MKTIQLKISDDCFERSRKIITLTGISNGSDLAANIAEAVESYRQMDQRFGMWAGRNREIAPGGKRHD